MRIYRKYNLDWIGTASITRVHTNTILFISFVFSFVVLFKKSPFWHNYLRLHVGSSQSYYIAIIYFLVVESQLFIYDFNLHFLHENLALYRPHKHHHTPRQFTRLLKIFSNSMIVKRRSWLILLRCPK